MYPVGDISEDARAGKCGTQEPLTEVRSGGATRVELKKSFFCGHLYQIRVVDMIK